ncbi:MAG: DUF2948 family protein [Alphaproteobacteria bacterium]|nr:DUF2948 family protein [Alphaproteobacteria bacterium]
MTGHPLKLLAQDAQDIQVMSAVLQDAIAPVIDMTFRASEKTFVMVVQRFCWDCAQDGQGQETLPASEDEPALRVFERINCAVDVEGVEAVHVMGIDLHNTATLLDLLTISLEEDALLLIFAGGGKIRVQLKNWRVRLLDFGESWPTTHCPRHTT